MVTESKPVTNADKYSLPALLSFGAGYLSKKLVSKYGRKGVFKTLGVHGNTYKKYTQNLLELLSKATQEDIKEGLEWYAEANRMAKDIAETAEGDTVFVTEDIVAQVISALSPAVKWERNLVDAAKMVQAHKDNSTLDKVTVATYNQNKEKAWSILKEKHALNTENNTGFKTYAFYRNILNPACSKYVTIDRHAFKAMLGNEDGGGVKLTPKQYRIAEQVYKDVAMLLGYVPCQLQAIIWVTYKRSVGR